jgi:hypothetical protein
MKEQWMHRRRLQWCYDMFGPNCDPYVHDNGRVSVTNVKEHRRYTFTPPAEQSGSMPVGVEVVVLN